MPTEKEKKKHQKPPTISLVFHTPLLTFKLYDVTDATKERRIGVGRLGRVILDIEGWRYRRFHLSYL